MRLAFVLFLCLLQAILSVPQRASATPARRPALHWVRGADAETCIDPRTLSERVQALVGPVLVVPSEADVSLEGRIDREASAYRVRLTVTDRAGVVVGERLLASAHEDCRSLDSMLAFVIAISIDPDLRLPDELLALFDNEEAPEARLLAQLEPESERTEVMPEKAEPLAAEATPSTEASASHAAREAPRFNVHLGGFVGLRTAPEAAPGVLLSTALRLRNWAALQAVLRGLPPLFEHPLEPGRRMRLHSYDAALQACLTQRTEARVRVAVCAGPELTLWVAEGQGFDFPARSKRLGAGLGLNPQLDLRLRQRWGLRLAGLARLHFRRTAFSATTAQGMENTVFRVPRVSYGASLGVWAEF